MRQPSNGKCEVKLKTRVPASRRGWTFGRRDSLLSLHNRITLSCGSRCARPSVPPGRAQREPCHRVMWTRTPSQQTALLTLVSSLCIHLTRCLRTLRARLQGCYVRSLAARAKGPGQSKSNSLCSVSLECAQYLSEIYKCNLAWRAMLARRPAPGLQNKSYWRVCRHFAARVTITFYTASARFQLAARSVALC